MNILFITDLYPVKTGEQTSVKTLHNFVNNWQSAGHCVDVIKPNFILNSFLRGKPFYKTGQYGNVYNVNYFTPFCFNVREKLSLSDKYDIVVAHMPSGILLAEKLDLPMVCAVHCSDIEVMTNPIYFMFKKRMKRAYDKARAIACRSFVLRDKFLKLFPQYSEKTFVAPSGIDYEIIRRDLDMSPDIKVFSCANFKKRKNIDKVIHAINGLKGFSLEVVGDGKERNKWENIKSETKFFGYQEPEKVFEMMQKSDVFMLPSVGETFGMVYLEAMAAGCIVVCSRNEGVDGIIKDGVNGFLTEPTVEGVKETLNRIKNLDCEEIKKILDNCYITICQYSSKACGADYLQQILKII